MSRRANIERHGQNHAAGGSDPIPGLGSGGGGGAKKILACWAGTVPSATNTNGLVWRVPYDSDGSSFSFTLTRVYARVEAPNAAATSFRVERASGGDVAFASPTTVATVTVTGTSDYETESTGLSVSAASGQLLRLVFVSVGAAGSVFNVEAVGSE